MLVGPVLEDQVECTLVAAIYAPAELRDLGQRQSRALDVLTTAHPCEQLGAFGLGVGLGLTFRGLPDLPPGGIAVAELVSASDGSAPCGVSR